VGGDGFVQRGVWCIGVLDLCMLRLGGIFCRGPVVGYVLFGLFAWVCMCKLFGWEYVLMALLVFSLGFLTIFVNVRLVLDVIICNIRKAGGFAFFFADFLFGLSLD